MNRKDKVVLNRLIKSLASEGKLSMEQYSFLSHLTNDHSESCGYCFKQGIAVPDCEDCKGYSTCSGCYDHNGKCIECGNRRMPGQCQQCVGFDPKFGCDYCGGSRKCQLCEGSGECGNCEGSGTCHTCK